MDPESVMTWRRVAHLQDLVFFDPETWTHGISHGHPAGRDPAVSFNGLTHGLDVGKSLRLDLPTGFLSPSILGNSSVKNEKDTGDVLYSCLNSMLWHSRYSSVAYM